jgi:hypothetical protein
MTALRTIVKPRCSILGLSSNLVKGNLSVGGAGVAAVASGEAGLLVAARSNHGPATEKFGEFRLRAKLLPSWASFLS